MSILILGGYGNVGSLIADELLDQTNEKIIIAGRRLQPARTLARQLGERATARQIDVKQITDYGNVLHGIQYVIVCFDLPDNDFPHACLERGIHYIDISAEPAVLSRIEALDTVARQQGATALISVGLIPGISNLMAKRGVERVENPYRVDNAILLGLGESFGAASASWSLSHIGDRYDENRIEIDMGPTFGIRTVYRFAFADQYTLPETLEIEKATSWSCYDRRISTHMIGLVRFLRIASLFEIQSIKRAAIWVIKKLAFGSDDFVLTSRVQKHSGDRMYQSWLIGRREAHVTATIAAKAIQLLKEDKTIPVGVYHINQLFDLNRFSSLFEHANIRFEETCK